MPAPKPARENLLVNLICSLVLPTLILTKFSGPETLGPVKGLLVALAFPIGYAIWDYSRRRQANLITGIGFASVLLTGGLGLFHATGFWFAVKEAAMPTIIGLAVFISSRTERPLVRTLLYNDHVFAVERIDQALVARGQRAQFEEVMRRLSYGFAATFMVSAVLNFAVARYLLQSAPGTPEFNSELGKMHSWGTVITLVPAMVMMMFLLFRLLKRLENMTGLKQDELMVGK